MENTSGKIDFGVMIWLDRPSAEAPELAVAAEKAGFDEIWLADHYFLRDVFVSLALMAQQTQRVRLGTAVAAVQLRHPALLASSMATIDELAEGRAVLGIGPGGHEFAAQFAMRPKSPLTMMRDATAIIESLLRGKANYEGRYFTAVEAQLGWKTRAIPVHMAARGPRMTELAGEIADGVLVHGINKGYIDYVQERLSTGAARAERPADQAEIGVILDVDVDDDVQASRKRLRPRLRIVAGGAWSDSLIPVYGLDPEAVATLKAAVSAEDPNASTLITERMIDVFGIAGPHGMVVERLQELRDSGVERIVLKYEGSPEETMEQFQRMKPVIKELRA